DDSLADVYSADLDRLTLGQPVGGRHADAGRTRGVERNGEAHRCEAGRRNTPDEPDGTRARSTRAIEMRLTDPAVHRDRAPQRAVVDRDEVGAAVDRAVQLVGHL